MATLTGRPGQMQYWCLDGEIGPFWGRFLELSSRVVLGCSGKGLHGTALKDVLVDAAEREFRRSLREPGERCSERVEKEMWEKVQVCLLDPFPGYEEFGAEQSMLAFAMVDASRTEVAILVVNASNEQSLITALDFSRLCNGRQDALVKRIPAYVYEVLRGVPWKTLAPCVGGELFDGDEICTSHQIVALKPGQSLLMSVRQREKRRCPSELFLDSFIRVSQLASETEARANGAIEALRHALTSNNLNDLVKILTTIVDCLGVSPEARKVAAGTFVRSLRWVERLTASRDWVVTVMGFIGILSRRAAKESIGRLAQEILASQRLGKVLIVKPEPESPEGRYLDDLASSLAIHGIDVRMIQFSESRPIGDLISKINIEVREGVYEECDVFRSQIAGVVEVDTVCFMSRKATVDCQDESDFRLASIVGFGTLEHCLGSDLSPSVVVTLGQACAFVPLLAKTSRKFKEALQDCRFVHLISRQWTNEVRVPPEIVRDYSHIVGQTGRPFEGMLRCSIAYSDWCTAMSGAFAEALENHCSAILEPSRRPFVGARCIPPGVVMDQQRFEAFRGGFHQGSPKDAKVHLQRRYFERRDLDPTRPLFSIHCLHPNDAIVSSVTEVLDTVLSVSEGEVSFLWITDISKDVSSPIKRLHSKYGDRFYFGILGEDEHLLPVACDFGIIIGETAIDRVHEQYFFRGTPVILAGGDPIEGAYDFRLGREKGNALVETEEITPSIIESALDLLKNDNDMSVLRSNALNSFRSMEAVTAEMIGLLLNCTGRSCALDNIVQERVAAVEPSLATSSALRPARLSTFSWDGISSHAYVFTSADSWSAGQVMVKASSHSMNSKAAQLWLPAGTHHYKFLIDGRWELHESAPLAIDENGFRNNVLVVPK